MLDLSLHAPLLNTTMQTNLLANVSIQQLKQAVTIREKIDGLDKELKSVTLWFSFALLCASSR